VTHETVGHAVRAVLRVSTYANHDALPARAALDQVRLALKGNVLYLHGGWQQLVDSLRAKALEAGVRIVEHHKTTHAEPGSVLAVPPEAVTELTGHRFEGLVPVRAACLDLALPELPRPRHGFALGIDEPLYFSVHSRTAELGPHHVVQLAKYLGPSDAGEDALPQLERLADAMQPGWREHVVARRFLPEMTVVNALPGNRPAVDAVPGLQLCGDWVGEEGMLVDCALASAAEAARRILQTPARAAA
jgi:phytoene dehydrogenase-like protein